MDKNRPIIIKRKKVVAGGGHHGGAWKGAYADFVTAMMAFFLLMWLLNATTEDQRKGIADYFNPSIPVSRISGGGSGALAGDSIFSENADLAHSGTGSRTERFDPETGSNQNEALSVTSDQIEELDRRIEAQLADGSSDHVLTRVTPEGFVIELIEQDGDPLFPVGSSVPSAMLINLLEIVVDATHDIENKISVAGHTDARPFRNTRAYSNWELSTDRANAARRSLVAAGMPDSKIVRVAGHGSAEPLMADPLAPQNRRISITLLKVAF